MVAGLLPREEAGSIEEVSEEERAGDEEVKSEDSREITEEGRNTDGGKVVIEVSGELEAAEQLRSEENLGQRVVEVNTSDEESEGYEEGVKDMREHHDQSDVKDEQESQPGQGREVVVEVESDDEEPFMEDMDSMATGLSNILATNFI